MVEQGLAFSNSIYMSNLSVSDLELKVAFLSCRKMKKVAFADDFSPPVAREI